MLKQRSHSVSILGLQKSMSKDISFQSGKSNKFVPFYRERDLGKII